MGLKATKYGDKRNPCVYLMVKPLGKWLLRRAKRRRMDVKIVTGNGV